MFRTIIGLIRSFSKNERYLFYGASLIFIVSLAFYGTSAWYRHTEIKPAQGGEYTEGVVGQPIAINPVLTGSNETDRDLNELLFADLLTLSDHYTTSTDNRTWTVTLKPNLVWSDGELLTSDDVIFTVQTIQNTETLSPLFASWQGITVERISDTEVRFKTKTPYAYFLDTLRSLKPIPHHIFEAIPVANLKLSAYNLEPIASGPYIFIRLEKQKDGFISKYYLEANPHYAGDKALIPKFNVYFFQNFKDAIAAFNQKSIDGAGGLDPSAISDIKIGYKEYDIQIPRYYAVFLNPSANATLKDASVRQALSLAVDKNKITDQVFGNHALVANGPLLPYLFGYDSTVYASSSFSLVSASATLESAGWKMNASSTRAKTDAKTKVTTTLEFEMVVPNIQFLVDSANILKDDWQKIGVNVTLTILSPAEVNSSIIKSRNYQMLLFGNILRGNSDIYSFWHSSQKFQPGLNLSLYENKTVDALLEAARKEFDDTKRSDDLSKIQAQLFKDNPALFLFSPNYLYVGPKSLGGFDEKFISTPSHRFVNVEHWYLRTARVFK